MPDTVWITGCHSWYLGPDGLPELWPWTPRVHRDMLHDLDLADFEILVADVPPPGDAPRAASSQKG